MMRATKTALHELFKHPAQLKWHEVTKVMDCYLSVNAMPRPMQGRENESPYRKSKKPRED